MTECYNKTKFQNILIVLRLSQPLFPLNSHQYLSCHNRQVGRNDPACARLSQSITNIIKQLHERTHTYTMSYTHKTQQQPTTTTTTHTLTHARNSTMQIGV